MKSVSLLCQLLFTSAALALPTVQLHGRDTSASTPYNASLPNVTIYATGGTIAGSASSNTEVTGYKAGALGVQVLIDAVPELANISNVNGIQFSNVGSQAMIPSMVLNLSQLITAELAKESTAGVVVTHGTDTLEETAFFLDATVKTEKPVVIVGAMRPATGLSADGPANLLEAVTLAASESAKGRGAMIVLNDRIASAYYTTKTNANSLDTFKSYEAGYLGEFLDFKPHFFFTPATPSGKVNFDVTETAELPQVDIIYGYQGLNAELIYAAVESGAQGLVLAGMGAGSWTDDGIEAVKYVSENNGTQVVYSRRTMDGYVFDGDYGISGGFQNPQKARYLLMLALNAGYSLNQTKTVFGYE